MVLVVDDTAKESSQVSRSSRSSSSRAAKAGRPNASFDLNYASPLRTGGRRPESTPRSVRGHGAERRRPASVARRAGYPVLVHVYDLGPLTKWTLNSWATDDSHIGAFHCGVEVMGLEFSFQAVPGSKESRDVSGLTWHEPKSHPRHIYRESVPLGLSPLGAFEISELLEGLEKRWPARSYNCFSRNCTDFAAILVAGLKVPEPFPAWVHGIAKRLVAAGPAGPSAPPAGAGLCPGCCPAPGVSTAEFCRKIACQAKVLPEEEIALPMAPHGVPEAEEILPPGGRDYGQASKGRFRRD